MRHDIRSIERLDPKVVLKIWAVLSFLAFVVLMSNRNAKPMFEGLLGDTNAGVYVSVVSIVFFMLWGAQQSLLFVEEPRALRRGIGSLALVHFGILFIIVAPSSLHTLRQNALASSFVTGLTAVTLALAYTWLTANGDPRPVWRRVIDFFRPGARRGERRLLSDYEERIRAAAAQEERNHLARELHDSIKQQVFAMHTAAATAEARLAGDPEGTREAIARVRESARDAMLEMDAMLDQMRAGSLTNASLVDALRKQAEAVRLRTGAEVVVEAGSLPPEEELSPALRQMIARVAQESLNNVAKHARPSHVRVKLGTQGSALVLTVTDDGAGYDPGQVATGLGLPGMRARAAESGGELTVDSGIGHGTTVRFAVLVTAVATAHPGRLALASMAGVVVLLLLSTEIGYVALVMLPLPLLELARFSIAWRRLRQLTRSAT